VEWRVAACSEGGARPFIGAGEGQRGGGQAVTVGVMAPKTLMVREGLCGV
jgi:hypothetical protein